MPYPLNVNDVVEVTFKGTLFEQIVMSVFHYKYIGTVPIANGPGALLTFLTNLSAAGELKDTYVACCGPEYTMTEQRAQIVYPTRQVYLSAAVNFPGTNAGACTAPNVSAVVLKSPDQAGHGRTGSLHVPGVPATGYAGGELTNAYALTMANLATKVAKQTFAVVNAGDMQALIWSHRKPTTPSVIQGARVNPYVRTMHRRTVGLGI
jgi:hypothetical protein